MMKKGEQMIHDRKHWNQAEDVGLAALPLEVTASAMESKWLSTELNIS